MGSHSVPPYRRGQWPLVPRRSQMSPARAVAVAAALLVLFEIVCRSSEDAPQQMSVGNSAACTCTKLEKQKDRCATGSCKSCKRKVNSKFVKKCDSVTDTDCCVGKKGGTITLPDGTKAQIEAQKNPKEALKAVMEAVAENLGHADFDVAGTVDAIKDTGFGKNKKDKPRTPTHCNLVRQGHASGSLTADKKVVYDMEAACNTATGNTGLAVPGPDVVRYTYMAVGAFGAKEDGKRHPVGMENLCKMKEMPPKLNCNRVGLQAKKSGGLKAKQSVPCSDLAGVEGLPDAVASKCGF